MRVVLTRPAEEAARWARDLQQRGHDPLVLPLIAIGPPPQPQALATAWAQLADCAAAMFVSATAVRGFFEGRPRPWPPGCRAWAPGPGTAAALQQAGVPAAQVDSPAAASEQFDSEALWPVVQDQARHGARVLLVQGAGESGPAMGRPWLADRLAARGVHVDAVAAYRRVLPAWSELQVGQARAAAADGSVWLFSSSEAVRNLLQLVPGTGWKAARAVATHERIARAAREAGFGVVCPSRPSVDAVSATLESIR